MCVPSVGQAVSQTWVEESAMAGHLTGFLCRGPTDNVSERNCGLGMVVGVCQETCRVLSQAHRRMSGTSAAYLYFVDLGGCGWFEPSTRYEEHCRCLLLAGRCESCTRRKRV